jgi:oxaloacetate decarboxylase alpha subunit/pyruvate carboxylase subunit B
MALLGTNRDTGFDIRKLAAINEILERDVLPKYKHLLDDSKVSIIDINVLLHQTPGGMLSNLVNQLKEMDALDRIDDVYAELPRVRKDLGQVPLVTPTSQIVGIQTVNNVLFGDEKDRYKMITAQVKDLCYGLYGKTAVPINPELQKKALKGYPRGEKPITCRPAEVIEPELEKAKQEIKDLAVDIDDVLIYALYPVTGKKFLRWKYGQEEPPEEVKPRTLEQIKAEQILVAKAKAGKLVEKAEKKEAPARGESLRTFNVFIEGDYYEVGVEEVGGAPVVSYMQQLPAAATPAPKPSAPPAKAPAPAEIKPAAPPAPPKAPMLEAVPTEVGAGVTMIAPMPGMIVSYEKKAGDRVKKGDTVVILEAMKMENALPSPADGVIKAVNFKSGDTVPKNAVLCIIG